MRAMILAAGLGTRLRPITHEIPKPMVAVANRPVMEHILRLVARNGFDEVIANLHWFPETIRSHFGDGSQFGAALTYSDEKELLGTAGGVRAAREFLGDSFLIISGDALTDIDLAAMREFHHSHDGVATLATRRVPDTSEYGVVITGEDGRVQGFQEKPDAAEALSDLANCGIYMFDAEIFDFYPAIGEPSGAGGPDAPEGFADWALDVFPRLMSNDVAFYSHEVDAYWNDIGNVTELHQGNVDALEEAVRVDLPGEKLTEGVRGPAGTDLSGVKTSGSVLLGTGVELGDGATLEGPVVVGDGVRVGAGAHVRDSILLPGASVPAGGLLIGAIAG